MRFSSWLKLMCGGLLASNAPMQSAELFHFQSGDAQTTLLEVDTSEGCSSCPPAEAWFSRLKESPKLWQDFVPVAFHVDYWDYLGWNDPFATKSHTKRQHGYATQWRSRSARLQPRELFARRPGLDRNRDALSRVWWQLDGSRKRTQNGRTNPGKFCYWSAAVKRVTSSPSPHS
jgi:uncharacterized protein DUF1223